MVDPDHQSRPIPASPSFNSSSTSSSDANSRSPPHQDSSRPLPLGSTTTPTSTATYATDPTSETNPISLLSASSPSRAFSRIWDRFSPPSISSPFSLPQQSTPLSLRSRQRSTSPPTPNASPPRPDDFTRRRLPPRLEQHDSASQLSFSLRRASTGARQTQEDDRNALRGRSLSGNNLAESWESFRLPGMAKWRSRGGKGKEVAVEDSDEEVSGGGVDDEACFVDGWEGKVGEPFVFSSISNSIEVPIGCLDLDFIVSLPSEISLYILLHLDFQSLLSSGLVSRQWRAFALDPLIWRDLFHQNPTWAIKPEAYEAAALAAQRSALQTPTAFTSPNSSGGGYFDLSRPSIPNLRRAASSFSKAGVKKVQNGADRVSQGGANFGKKISGLVNDIGNMSITSPNGSRNASRAPSESGGGGSSEQSVETPSTPRSLARRTTATALMTLSTPAGPSTSTLPTHAFASPPSTTLSRTNSATALSSLASSMASLPLNRTPSSRRTSSQAAHIPPPSPAMSIAHRLEPLVYLDWPKLYKDRWLLEKRWNDGNPSWNWLEGHEDSVYCVQFDEKKVISGSVSSRSCSIQSARVLTIFDFPTARQDD